MTLIKDKKHMFHECVIVNVNAHFIIMSHYEDSDINIKDSDEDSEMI